MLNIRQVKHLAKAVGVSEKTLTQVAENPEQYCDELVLFDPAKPDKPRDVLSVRGRLRALQRSLYRRVLLRRLVPSQYSHGGIQGRDIRTNVAPHLGSTFVFTTDISDFYPSISHNRVYRIFSGSLACSPDVARLCTRLCTYDYHLALGLITSPILADQIMRAVDARIGGACARNGLVFTRYVDDITVSGQFDMAPNKSGFASTVRQILADHGFKTNPQKDRFGRASEDVAITKITIHRGHPDVRCQYIVELDRQLNDAMSLARGGEFTGPYYTEAQIRGRVQFVCWINPGRRHELRQKFDAVPWDLVKKEAQNRGYCVAKKKLMKRSDVAVA